MCGIVGYVGSRSAVDVLLRGLKRLEYRGYDSAGVAIFRNGLIEVTKSQGKLENVEMLLNGSAKLYADSHCGIGHTRWATHGKPTTQNAHPHRAGHVVLVHNGIIENYQEIKKELMARGHKPVSETDSELFGYLVLELMDSGESLLDAVRKSFSKLKGQCSVVVMSEKEPGTVIGVRNGSPLVAATDPKGGSILASDAQPLLEITKNVVFLEHGDVVVGTALGLSFYELSSGKKVERESTELDWSLEKLDKQGYEHFMLKEIHEQPVALVDTINGTLDRAKTDPFPFADQKVLDLLANAKDVTLVACGTAWHAALLGKYWLERWLKIPVQVDLASEFRYRGPVLGKDSLVIAVSQSGETADTLAAVREAHSRGVPTIAITNTRGSTLSREAKVVCFTFAGPEIGVAATKTFTTQMMMLLLMAGSGAIRKKSADILSITALFDDVVKIPHLLTSSLDGTSDLGLSVKKAANALQDARGFFFIGRGYSYPLALEGALKLKEIAYVHAEGYAAGELKHGPIAVIDEKIAVIVLAPRDLWRDKTVSNLEEVKARGARIIGIGDSGDQELESLCDHWIPVKTIGKPVDECLLPFILAPIVQLLCYELALLRGTDVDKPRNLAKSVTVE